MTVKVRYLRIHAEFNNMSFRKYYQVFKTYSYINSPEYKKRLEELEPYLMKFLANKGKVLDLACGVGGFSFLLEDYGFEVVGVDIDEEMIKKAREYKKKEILMLFLCRLMQRICLSKTTHLIMFCLLGIMLFILRLQS